MPRYRFKSLVAAGSFIALMAGIGLPATANAHYVPAPCDFVTAGGFVFKDDGSRLNFGVHGGCKNGDFWGHINFVDHANGFHANSTRITGYLWNPAVPNQRDICGWARINEQEQEVMFRVRVTDNGEPGLRDTFGVIIDNWHTAGERFYRVSSRLLGGGGNGGGNVQLHKGNRSNSAGPGFFSLQEWQMCGDMTPGP